MYDCVTVDPNQRFHNSPAALSVNFAFAGSKKIVSYSNVFTQYVCT